jgi:hypothetical protein
MTNSKIQMPNQGVRKKAQPKLYVICYWPDKKNHKRRERERAQGFGVMEWWFRGRMTEDR